MKFDSSLESRWWGAAEFLIYLLAKKLHGIIVAHVLKVDAIDFKKHVTRLNATIGGHHTILHNAAHIDATVACSICLAHYADAQKTGFVQVEYHLDDIQGCAAVGNATEGRGSADVRPFLSPRIQLPIRTVLAVLGRNGRTHGCVDFAVEIVLWAQWRPTAQTTMGFIGAGPHRLFFYRINVTTRTARTAGAGAAPRRRRHDSAAMMTGLTRTTTRSL